MKIEEWENLYRILEDIYFEFSLEYDDVLNGRNQCMRDKVLRKVKSNIVKAAFHIKRYDEAIHLLTKYSLRKSPN